MLTSDDVAVVDNDDDDDDVKGREDNVLGWMLSCPRIAGAALQDPVTEKNKNIKH